MQQFLPAQINTQEKPKFARTPQGYNLETAEKYARVFLF